MPKTILIVDDEKDIVDLLRYNLEKEGYRVIAAHNGTEGLKRAQDRPDLILLDIMMPGMNGLEVVKRLKKDPATEAIPVLFLTAKKSEVDEIVGLELGADDYILKPISIGKIVARIHAVLRRHEQSTIKGNATPEVISIGELVINVANYTVKIAGAKVPLPRKEFETLVYLATHRGRVVTRETLLNAVWGTDVHVVDRTVDVHIRKIREKLGPYAENIETVKGVGYRFRE